MWMGQYFIPLIVCHTMGVQAVGLMRDARIPTANFTPALG